MKTITKTIEVYKFNELDDEAKQKAIEKLYDININHDWYDSTYEDAANAGIIIESFDIDRGSYCKGKLEDAEQCIEYILKNHGASCDTYKTCEEYRTSHTEKMDTVTCIYETSCYSEDNFDGIAHDSCIDAALDEWEKDFKQAIFEEYLCILRKEYEHITSEEAIIESIEANEYDFTKDGLIY